MAKSPTADWEKLGNSFYRKIQLYTQVFDHDLELENYLVAGAPYSGALACYRSSDRIQTYRGSRTGKSSIDIYSCSGRLIRRLNWDKGVIRGIGWSEDEKLLVVLEDGTVKCYFDLQSDFEPFSLGHGAEDHGVVDCRFWSHGFVALLGNNTLVSVTNYAEPRPRVLAPLPNDSISSWTLIPPSDSSPAGAVEVLVAVGKSIYVVDESDAEDRALDAGPFKHVAVSPNGNSVSLYTEDGKVWVVSSDFQNRLGDYDSKVKTVPKDLMWVGNDAVALAWEDEVHLIGPNGEAAKYFYDGWVCLVPDIDGIRLFTNDVCEFLQKVPDVTLETFRLGSTSPASVLLDAVEQLDRKSPKADDDIQLIKQHLDEAVDACIRAAGHEFSIHWQKQLLKAASFGKSVLDMYNSDDFVDMTETLRVLNSVRFFETGLPLSFDQYVRLTPERLVQRLMNRNEYLLALKISDYLRLPTDRIYVHWACQKVRVSSDPEDLISRTIVSRLKGKKGISFEEIARAAFDEGRSRLATDLLNYEPRAGKQVPLLMSMNEEVVALDKAIESGDTDLIMYVLLALRKKLPLATFFRTITTRPTATALVEFSAWTLDQNLLKDLYYQDDRRLDGANLLFSQALDASSPASATDKMKLATKLLADSKEHTFVSKSIDETARLLKAQESLDKDMLNLGGAPTSPSASSPNETFIGLSLNETIFRIIRQSGAHKKASRLAADFRVPEKTFWWIRVRALVARRDWTEIEDMARSNRKSPIGWEPFFEAILAAGNARLASTFVPRCGTNLATARAVKARVEMYVKCGMISKAAEEAGNGKDLEALEGLRSKASGERDSQEVERWIGIVGKRPMGRGRGFL